MQWMKYDRAVKSVEKAPEKFRYFLATSFMRVRALQKDRGELEADPLERGWDYHIGSDIVFLWWPRRYPRQHVDVCREATLKALGAYDLGVYLARQFSCNIPLAQTSWRIADIFRPRPLRGAPKTILETWGLF